MITNVAPTLTTEIYDGTSYISAPHTSTAFAWSTTTNTNDTLTISIGWSRFPEVSQIRYRLPASALKNAFGETLAADIQQSFTTAGSGLTFTMSDTGQTQCSSGGTGTGAMAACPQSLTGQDGDFVNTPNARSFTGPTLYGANDYTTKDNVTGLVWKTCSEGLSGPTCAAGSAATLTWYNALNQCGILNSANSGAGYGGQKTWRLPTSMELESLPNLGTFSPAIDTAYFPATVSADYWSSTNLISFPNSAHTIFFDKGNSSNTLKTNPRNVRCVSTPSTPSASGSLADNADGTVSDSRTNLRWQKCSYGETYSGGTCTGSADSMTWNNTVSYCEGLNLAGKSWRLPSKNEFLTIIDRGKSTPTIDAVAFSVTTFAEYATSTTDVSSAGANILSLSIFNGGSTVRAKGAFPVRCVTNGP